MDARFRSQMGLLAALCCWLWFCPGLLQAADQEAQDSRSSSAQSSAAEKDRNKSTDNESVDNQPGFFDFAKQSLFSRDELEIHISVKGPLLTLVASAARESDPELAEILHRLKGVEVRVYTLDETKRKSASSLLDELASSLEKDDWRPAITVRVQRDHGYAFLRYLKDGGDPVGLAAMYLTGENQAVFVNIVGPMNTTEIGRLARRFDLDLLAVAEP